MTSAPTTPNAQAFLDLFQDWCGLYDRSRLEDKALLVSLTWALAQDPGLRDLFNVLVDEQRPERTAGGE